MGLPGQEPPSSENVLENECGRLQVKTVARREETPWRVNALFDVAMDDKLDWTVPELEKLTRELDTCSLRVTDWLMLR